MNNFYNSTDTSEWSNEEVERRDLNSRNFSWIADVYMDTQFREVNHHGRGTILASPCEEPGYAVYLNKYTDEPVGLTLQELVNYVASNCNMKGLVGTEVNDSLQLRHAIKRAEGLSTMVCSFVPIDEKYKHSPSKSVILNVDSNGCIYIYYVEGDSNEVLCETAPPYLVDYYVRMHNQY